MNFRDLLGRARASFGGRPAQGAGSIGGGMCVRATFQSDAGGRVENEDNCLVRIPVEGEPSFSRGWLAMVSDGMGGHNAGSLASRLAVDCVAREYYENPDPPAHSLRSAMFSANRRIRREARRSKLQSGMGATCTVLVGVGDRAFLAHVGDSRLYLVRDGLISQLTEDHSAAGDLVRRGLLTPSQAKVHERRNIVLRALGAERDVAVAEWDTPLAMSLGDRFILCTDGLSNTLDDEDILSAGADPDCEAACQSLMALAAKKQATDNVTIVIVDVYSQSGQAAELPADSQIPEVAT
jgi:PPM family protein phosphatase